MALCVERREKESREEQPLWVLDELLRVDEKRCYYDMIYNDGRIDVNYRHPGRGMSALMLAAREGNIDVVRYLCRFPGIDLNLRNNLGWTALMFATDSGFERITRFLICHSDVEMNQECIIDGATALILATSRGYTSIVRTLLEREDLDLNKQNSIGWTALMLASFENHKAIAEMLLKMDSIDLSKRSKTGVTSIMMASMRGNMDIVWMSLLKGSSAIKPSWFQLHGFEVAYKDLVFRASQQASFCRQMLQRDEWTRSLPNSLRVKILALAFGDGLVFIGGKRADLPAIERLILLLL